MADAELDGIGLRVVEVFADVWCPFTHVGLRRLVARRTAMERDDVVLRIRAWPLEFVNGKPLAPDLVAHEIEALREVVAPDLFAGFDPAHLPHTTLPALALTDAAYRRGMRSGEAVGIALRTALFEEGRDVADPAELQAIGRVHGLEASTLDEGAIRQDWEDGLRRGVIGSPHFFVDGEGFFCPTLIIKRVDNRFHIAPNPAELESFVAAVFDSPRAPTPGAPG